MWHRVAHRYPRLAWTFFVRRWRELAGNEAALARRAARLEAWRANREREVDEVAAAGAAGRSSLHVREPLLVLVIH